MKNSGEKINEPIIKETNENLSSFTESKTNENTKNLLNNGILSFLLNKEDIYYSKFESINSLLKSYHKSFMKNIGVMIKIILKNSKINKYEFTNLMQKIFDLNDEAKPLTEIESYINIIHHMELNHIKFNSKIKKTLLKFFKHYNKRKNRLKNLNIFSENMNLFNFCLVSNFSIGNFNIYNQGIDNQININQSPVIINKIENKINGIDNNPDNLTNNSKRYFSEVSKGNELIIVKLSNFCLVGNCSKNNTNSFKHLERKKESNFELKCKKINIYKNICFDIVKEITNFNILNNFKNNKQLLNQKDSEINELKIKNKLNEERISLLEKNNIKFFSENSKLKSELNLSHKTIRTLKLKLKQNEKTISYLNKQKENDTKLVKEEKMEIKNLNNDLSELNIENNKLNKDVNPIKNLDMTLDNYSRKKDLELQQSYLTVDKTHIEFGQEKEKNNSIMENFEKVNKFSEINNNHDYTPIIEENEKLKKKLKEKNENLYDLNKKLEEQNKQIRNYKSTKIIEERKYINLEKKYNEIKQNLEEMQKLKYSSNTFKRTSNINEININDITPNKYSISKYLEIDGIKWCLFKKKSTCINQRNHYYKRYQRFSSINKTNDFEIEDKSDLYMWKQILDSNDLNKFNFLKETEKNENQNKINILEKNMNELKEKLNKKEEDFNRINLNYAKLLKRSRIPENNKEKMLEEINSLKKENKILNDSISKLQSEKNIIGISFIEDDLESSFFIDNFCFDKILDEIEKSENRFMAMNNTIQNSSHSNIVKNIEEIKLENNSNHFI